MKRTILFALGLSSVLSAVAFLGTNWIPEESHEWYLLSVVTFLLGISMAAGIFGLSKRRQIVLGAGSAWGFMFTIGIMLSVEQRELSIQPVAFPMGLLVVPAIFFAFSQIGAALGRILEPGEACNAEKPPGVERES